MIKNYLKIAFRNLKRHRVFSLINILGLTIGITSCFLIFLYVKFELSYDSMHSKSDRIYRVVADIKTPTEVLHPSGPAWAVSPHLEKEFPEIEHSVRVLSHDNILIQYEDKLFEEKEVMWADSAFFQVFDFKLKQGDPVTALKEPFSIVMTESAAKKYFGNENPVGKTVKAFNDGNNVKVTGVMEDIPENSQIKGDMLLSLTTITGVWNQDLDNQWGNYSPQAFALTVPGTDPKKLEKKFPAFLEKYNGKEMAELKMYASLFLEPLRDVYLKSTRNSKEGGNMTNVYIFSIIAIFLIVIACINFINLTTARSVERAKEVGVRKVVGAGKGQLAGQFIGESVMLCMIAFVLSVGLSILLIPPFNQLAGKTISHGILERPDYLLLLFTTSLSIGILAGIYPALVLTSFRPVAVLKGRFATGTKGNFLRKALVISQFTISTGLIIGTIIVYTQMKHMRDKNLGFQKDHVIVVDTNNDKGKKAFKESLASIPGVVTTSYSSSVPGGGNPGAYSHIENVNGEMQEANLDLYFVDFDYIPLYKIQMVAGRAFSKEFMTDTTQAIILNEAAVKNFGYAKPEDAIGKRFSQWGREGQIIGVVKDFHFRSAQTPIKPLSMRIELDQASVVSIKVNAGNLPNTMASIEDNWHKAMPGRPYSYFFLDEFFDKQYKGEDQFGRLFLNFAILAIFISCLGLLGLASYSTLQRTKEIGIRKVLGASVTNVIGLLSKEFILLVLLAFVLASPVAWYFMHEWLKDFAYRIDISWWIFASAGLIAVLIALFTISFQAVRAALTNPVKSLRTE